jgi:hypothetical protein
MRLAILSLLLALALTADSVGGLQFTPPAGWNSEGTAPMRAATYKIPPAPGDSATAECVVYFFGAGQGGAVQANIDRWAGQFTEPGGKPSNPKTTKKTVHGLPVTLIDVSGDYSGMGGPMGTATAAVPGYRLLGAIIEDPGGNVFLKFTGQQKTVAASQTKFEQLLESFEKR